MRTPASARAVSQSCPAGIQPCQQPQGPSISRIDDPCPPAVGPCGHRRGRGMPDCPAGQGRPARADCAADTGNPARRGRGRDRGRLSRGGGAGQFFFGSSLADANFQRRSTRKRRWDDDWDASRAEVEKTLVNTGVFVRSSPFNNNMQLSQTEDAVR